MLVQFGKLRIPKIFYKLIDSLLKVLKPLSLPYLKPNMSSQVPSSSPNSPPAPHGGANDPNEFRLRQARAQQVSQSSTPSMNSPGVISTENEPHGGDMDPNEVRLRLMRTQQTSGPSSPALSGTEPNDTVISNGGLAIRQAETQPAQYGSSSHLINMPSPPPSGYNVYPNSQNQQSPHSGHYPPTQFQTQPFSSNQTQQAPQGPYSGLPPQVGH